MAKRQHISFFPDEHEAADFEKLKEAFERRTNSDTVRAMIRFCKKNLPQIVDISTTTAAAAEN